MAEIGHQLARIDEPVEITDFRYDGHRGHEGNSARGKDPQLSSRPPAPSKPQ